MNKDIRNPDEQMANEFYADDIYMRMAWKCKPGGGVVIETRIEDTSELPADTKSITLQLTPVQAGAIAALFTMGGDSSGDLEADLYDIAEFALVDIPRNLRPIP